MRHDCRAEDADRDVEHPGIGDDLWRWNESFRDAQHIRPGRDQLPCETATDDRDQRDDESFDVSEAFVLQKHNRQNVQRRNTDAKRYRDSKQ